MAQIAERTEIPEHVDVWLAGTEKAALLPIQMSKGDTAIRLASRYVENRELRLQGHEPVTVSHEISWEEDPFQDRTWRLWFHCLTHVSYLTQAAIHPDVASEDRRSYLGCATEIVRSWIRKHIRDAFDHEFAWHDHVVALRGMALVHFAEMWRRNAGTDPDREFAAELLSAIERHGTALLDPDLYREKHNHGIDQDKALLAISLTIPQLPESPEWETIALKRLADQIDACITVDGVHKEHSPDYEGLVSLMLTDVQLFLQAHDKSMPVAEEAAKRLYRKIAHTLRPDGYWPIVGDTVFHSPANLTEKLAFQSDALEEIRYTLSAGAEGTRPRDKHLILPRSGCAVFRETWTPGRMRDSLHCYFVAAFNSRIHKHHDDLSLVVCGHGHDYLVEGGRYSYDYSDPYRQYCESAHAHNVVIVNEANTDLRRLNVGKSGIVATFVADEIAALDSVHYLYKDVEVRRLLVYLEPNSMLIFDRVSARESMKATQNFLLAPELSATRHGSLVRAQLRQQLSNANNGMHMRQLLDPDKSIELSSGQSDPVRGWMSRRHRQVEPATAVTTSRTGLEVAFVTLMHFQEHFDSQLPVTGNARWDGAMLRCDWQIGQRHESLSFAAGHDFAELNCRGVHRSIVSVTPYEREHGKSLAITAPPSLSDVVESNSRKEVTSGSRLNKILNPGSYFPDSEEAPAVSAGRDGNVQSALAIREYEIQKLRTKLEAVSTKRREAVQRFRESCQKRSMIAEQLKAITAKHNLLQPEHDQLLARYRALRDEITAKESQVVSSQESNDNLRKKNDHLQAQVQQLKTKAARYQTLADAASRKMNGIIGTLDRTKARMKLLEGKVKALDTRSRVRRQQIEELGGSVRWRVGNALVLAANPSMHTLKLPVRLAKLYREGRQRIRDRERGVVTRSLPSNVDTPNSESRKLETKEAVPATVKAAAAVKAPAAPKPKNDRPRIPPRRNLDVACVLDEFSLECFRPEARLHELTPTGWQREIEEADPAVLFIESTWRGKDEQWRHLVTHTRRDGDGPLRDIVEYCKKRDIPTVFWNKEDPANFEHFYESASWFDVIFTTDSDCLDRYRDIAGHDRCYALPFAAQEKLHNPIGRAGGEWGEIAFAGTWYSHKHDGRRQDAEIVLEPAVPFGVHIYDRMHTFTGPGWQNYQWPEHYEDCIRGGLPYAEMLEAYKKYHIFLNVNSVRNSPTMCARRVFEIVACGTNLVSAYAPAIENFLGADCVSLARTPAETSAALEALVADKAFRNQRAVRGIRRVMAEHLYIHRFAEILKAVGITESDTNRTLTVLLRIENKDDLARGKAFLADLTYPHVAPIWVVPDSLATNDLPGQVIAVTEAGEPQNAIANALAETSSELVYCWSSKSPQAGDWLADLAYTFAYFDGDVACKPSDGRRDELLYKPAASFDLKTTVMTGNAAQRVVPKLLSGATTAIDADGENLRVLATDTVGLT